jgi:hypothetical protein
MWNVASYALEYIDEYFGGTYCLYLQGRRVFVIHET